MNLAARYRAITYREYVDIAPTGSQLTPPEFVPSHCKILCLNPENPTIILEAGWTNVSYVYTFLSLQYIKW